MQQLLMVYHSQSGSTERMAEAVCRGVAAAGAAGVTLEVRDALEATSDDLLAADGLILGTPENFGYMSGALKVFFDRVYDDCLDRVAGLPTALFVRAGNDGSGAISSVTRILAGLNVRLVQEPLLIAGPFDESRLVECEELGTLMAAGLEAGIF